MPEFEPHYMIYVNRENNLDTMELHVEARPDLYSDNVGTMISLTKKLTAQLNSILGIAVKVKIVEPRSLARSEGKAKRVFDNRMLK